MDSSFDPQQSSSLPQLDLSDPPAGSDRRTFMHGRDSHGIHASAASVAKIPYRDAEDGISLTTTIVPTGLGRTEEERIDNLTAILDRFFEVTGYHMNINVLNRETLMDAMDHPEKYPSLTIRVSGYAVNFIRLTREQQMDVINRTFHGA